MDPTVLLTEYWDTIARHDAAGISRFFQPDAKSFLHDSDEVMSVDDWVAHLEGSSGQWAVTVDRIDRLDSGGFVTVTFHRSPDWVGFVVSFFTIADGLIAELHEYYSPCDDFVVPQWRADLAEHETLPG